MKTGLMHQMTAPLEGIELRWAEPQFSRSKVNKAGDLLVKPGVPPEEASDAQDIVNNWRSAHGLPLTWMVMNLRRLAKAVDANRIVAQRIKRLSSIREKLSREPKMSLAQMQDIGGCRAIVKSVKHVEGLVERFESSRMSHELYAKDDYIATPKDSGYRGVHLKYKYKSEKYPHHCGLRIEIQIRSQLQHTWATAVETVGVFTKQALKSSAGDEEWLRFFALMSAAIAKTENGEPIPNVPRTQRQLIAELRQYEKRLSVLQFLHGYSAAAQIAGSSSKTSDHEYFLLKLDANIGQLEWSGFSKDRAKQAASKYYEVEREIEGKAGMQAVLVSVEKVNTLERAYPNYFLDTRAFAALVSKTLQK